MDFRERMKSLTYVVIFFSIINQTFADSKLDGLLDTLAPQIGRKTLSEIPKMNEEDQVETLEKQAEVLQREINLSKGAYCSGFDYSLADKQGTMPHVNFLDRYYFNPKVLFKKGHYNYKKLAVDYSLNPSDILGTAKNDLIKGDYKNNKIKGLDGNDFIRGLAGDDIVNGNNGHDFVNGNRGNDIVRGGKGNDRVHGGSGDDKLFGDLGNDTLTGDKGNDRLEGGEGNDIYFYKVNSGRDTIREVGTGLDAILCEGVYTSVGNVERNGDRLTITFSENNGNKLIIENSRLIEYIDCAGLGAEGRKNLEKGKNPEQLKFLQDLEAEGAKAFENLTLRKWIDGANKNPKKTADAYRKCSSSMNSQCKRDKDAACANFGDEASRKRCELNFKTSLYKSCYYIQRMSHSQKQYDEVENILGGLKIASCAGGSKEGCGGIVGSQGDSEPTEKIIQDQILDRTSSTADEGDYTNEINLTAGNDTKKGSEERDYIRGRGGDDVITGMGGDDFINGNQGNDTINGNMGNDIVRGGSGNDTVRGGQGNDQVFGDLGNDILYGDKGNDTLDGGDGDDTYIFRLGDGSDIINESGSGKDKLICQGFQNYTGTATTVGDQLTITFSSGDVIKMNNRNAIEEIQCGKIEGLEDSGDTTTVTNPTADEGDYTNVVNLTAGNDTKKGSEERDYIRGRGGDDVITGMGGDDFINGNQGNDTINGNMGNDIVRGGSGNDTVRGGQGNDQVFGDLGNDILYGDKGNDTLDGGDGDDNYIFRLGDGNDTINESGNGNDKLLCEGISNEDGISTINGNELTLSFSNGDSVKILDRTKIEVISCGAIQTNFAELNKIEGTAGDDENLVGSNGNDEIYGFGGNDNIRGLDGDDVIRGGDGDDSINGNLGNDSLNGNMGNDLVRGGKGNDEVRGGKGNDWVYGDDGMDVVMGNIGNDILLGMSGNDYLDGGANNDTYYFFIGDGMDRIKDSGGGDDKLICVGFPLGSGVVGRSGNRVSITFETGDSVVIENADEIETINCGGEKTGVFVDNLAPKL